MPVGSPHAGLLVLLAVTAVWGVTFVQVKDAVAIYPLFAFLAVRFAIATATLAPVAAARLRGLGRRGRARGRVARGAARRRLRAADRGARADDRLERGLRHRHVRRADAGDRVRRLPAPRRRAPRGPASRSRPAGLALLSGIHAGSASGDLLVLGGAAVYALQIVLMERFAPRYDPLAFTAVEMGAAFALLAVVALGSASSRRRAAGRCGARCSSPGSSRARSRSSRRRGRSGGRARRGRRSSSRREPVFAAALRLHARGRPARRRRLGRLRA